MKEELGLDNQKMYEEFAEIEKKHQKYKEKIAKVKKLLDTLKFLEMLKKTMRECVQ